MVVVEKEDFNIKTLNELDKKYDPWIVIVEYNGMWDQHLFLEVRSQEDGRYTSL